MDTQPGEVWLADLGLTAKNRPVIVVSRYDSDPPRALVIYVPLTTQNRNSGSLPTVRLERRLGKLPELAMADIKQAIRFALAL